MTLDDDTGTPVGTVAQEAALLADLLAARGWGGDAADGSARPDADGAAGEQAPHEERTRRGAADEHASECTCGGRTPAACRICPVCQLISFVQQVSPDTIERVADVVALAATALRDLATAQREQREPPPDPAGGPAPAASDQQEGQSR